VNARKKNVKPERIDLWENNKNGNETKVKIKMVNCKIVLCDGNS
jgi:hypothetical protein